MRRALLISFIVSACGGHHHSHEEEGGHGHGHGGGVAITQWGTNAELFAEHSVFVTGHEAEFAIHLTTLADFKPVLKGLASVELVQSDGKRLTVRSAAPARPGIYTPKLTPTVAGPCTLTISLQTAAFKESFVAKSCVVHTKAPKEEEEDESGISFLKEQQWKVEFATVPVAKRPMQRTVQVYARVKPAAGRHAHLTAALSGRVRFPKISPVVGATVKRGQLLGMLTPPLRGATNRASLQAGIAGARAELEAAKADHDRVTELAKQDAIPQRRIREATSRRSVATSRLRAARERLREYDASASGRGGGNLFRVRSPINGMIVSVDVTEGQTVGGGVEMFTIIDVSTVWIEGRVFEPDIPALLGARTATFTVAGHTKPFVIDQDSGRLVTVGHVVDEKTRTVPIVFEVANPGNVLRIGQTASLQINAGTPSELLAVPTSAVLIERGRSVVFVHTSGETFEQRMIRTGTRSREWVAVVDGLKAGERVVTRGAYTVKLAASGASTPGHGHAH